MIYAMHDDVGRITSVMVCSDQNPWPKVDGIIECEHEPNENTEYVVGGVVTKRQPQNTTISGGKLTKLPAPCTIRINDQTYECVDTTADLSFEFPGTYTVTVESFPYLDWTTEITV